MKRMITYLAADKRAGFTVEELRAALRHATAIERIWSGFRGKPWRIDVEEPVSAADPNVKIGL
jgi:hypothetical protein